MGEWNSRCDERPLRQRQAAIDRLPSARIVRSPQVLTARHVEVRVFTLLIGAASVVTFAATFYVTTAILPHNQEGVRLGLLLSVGITFAVGYGLFVLTDRLGLRNSAGTSSGTLFK